jgi:protein SCO1/2
VSRLLAFLLALVASCGPSQHEGVGVVVDVQPELRQIHLDHEEIAGLMPAMKMNLDVADPALLSGVARGDRVRFQLSVDGSSYRIVALERIGKADPDAAPGQGLGAVVPEEDAAPPFVLIDQDGRALGLEALRGSAVLLDFVYTSCPGPCPILTSARVEVQRALPETLRPRVRFVSISLDPERDTPAALREYALARGADLAGWSFLTGEPAAVDAVLQSYGVGRVREADGAIEHVVVTFLIDAQGRIVKRYFGLDHGPDEYLRDLTATTREASPG